MMDKHEMGLWIAFLLGKIVAFMAGLGLLAYGLLLIVVGGCHGGGGFCAARFNATYYVWGAILLTLAGSLLAVVFTRKKKPIAITCAAFLLAAVIAIAVAEASR